MSGMGCVGSSGSSNVSFQLQVARGSNVSSASGSAGGVEDSRQQERDARLDDALSAAGVDEDTASAIEAELKQAFEKSQAAGTFPPDPKSMKETVDGIFAKYRLDASQILGPPPQGGPHHGGPPSGGQGGSSSSNEDGTAALLALLQQLAKNGATPDDLSQMFADAMTGIDQTV